MSSTGNYKIMAFNGDSYAAVERGAGGGRETIFLFAAA